MYNVLGPKRKACGIDVFQYAYEGLFILGLVEDRVGDASGKTVTERSWFGVCFGF